MSGVLVTPCVGSRIPCPSSVHRCNFQRHSLRRSQSHCAAGSKDDLQQMEQYRQGLSQALQDKEKDLKAQQKRGISRGMRIYAAAVSETPTALPELDKDGFYPFLKEAGDTLVIVDFYTDWCGPCKVMLPELEKMSQERGEKAKFVKFNCNAKNKTLGQELNIKVAPTFHLYKQSKKVAEMTGAKIDELRSLIDKNI